MPSNRGIFNVPRALCKNVELGGELLVDGGWFARRAYEIGDYLFVYKPSYGYSRYSFPLGLLPMEGRVWTGGKKPQRGDVIVFQRSHDPNDSSDYVKRLIGLPGDRVQMRDGVLYLNGQQVRRQRIADFVNRDEFGGERAAARYRETLPNGVSYDTLDLDPDGFNDNTPVYEVPSGYFFVLGDNSAASKDSRLWLEGHHVDRELLIGKAIAIG